MRTDNLFELLYTELKNQGLWFVTKKDDNWLVKPKKYYTLNDYGEIKDTNKVEKEINDYLGDGAETTLEAIRIFISDGLADGSIACNCNLSTVFKDKPVNYTETAVEVKNIEPKKIEPEITGSNKKEESKKLNESEDLVISEDLNTGLLPIVNVDLYSLYSGEMLDNVPEGEEDRLDELIMEIAPGYIEDTVKEVLPSVKITPIKVYHPKEYNFGGDELEFNLKVNSDEYNELKNKALEDEKFNQFLKDNYKSYDGFISTMPDSIEEFNEAVSWKQLVQVIMFYIGDTSSINDTYLDEFLEKVGEEFSDIEEDDSYEGLSESKDVKNEDYFSKMTEIREKAENYLIERLKKEFPEAKVSNVITSKYSGDRILLTLGKKRISIFFETESGEDGKPWFMILLDAKNKKSYSDSEDGIIDYIKNNLVKDKKTEDIFDDVSNGIAEYGVYDDTDIRNIKDRYKEPINAKRNKIRNFQDKRFTNTPVRDIINKGVTHVSYEKMPNERIQAYKNSKKEENVQRRLEEENNKSANIISDMFTSKDFDSESKMGKIVMRTSNLFNALSDKGYDVQVAFDNGESTNVILLGQQGGQVNITIDNDTQPLKAYANGSFEITDDNIKILNDIQEDIQNI